MTRLALAVALSGMLLVGCTRPSATGFEPTRLRIAGSTSLQPVLESLARAYRSSHPDVLVEIRGGGSAEGLRALRAGEADLAAVSWKPETEEVPREVQAVPFARDGIAIVVHRENPVADLTLLQLRALYSGQVADWATLGGSSGEPLIVSREEGSGDRAAFEALVMGTERVTLNALVMPTAQATTDYVARHPAAIGYSSMAVLPAGVRAIAVEGTPLSRESVETGRYHLGRLVYLYARRPASTAAQGFLDFVLSPAGQAIVAEHHAALR